MAKSLNFNTSNFKNRKKKKRPNKSCNPSKLLYSPPRHPPISHFFLGESEKKNIIQRYIQNPVNYSILFYLTGI